MIPHPTAGLDHLRPWFGAALVPAKDCSLTLRIDAAVAERPFRSVARDRMTGPPPPDWRTLRGDGSLAGSAQVVVAAMLEEGMPTAERLAAAAGLSLRSLQRHLAEEGTSFTTLLEGVRREAALRQIVTAEGSLGDLSATPRLFPAVRADARGAPLDRPAAEPSPPGGWRISAATRRRAKGSTAG